MSAQGLHCIAPRYAKRERLTETEDHHENDKNQEPGRRALVLPESRSAKSNTRRSSASREDSPSKRTYQDRTRSPAIKSNDARRGDSRVARATHAHGRQGLDIEKRSEGRSGQISVCRESIRRRRPDEEDQDDEDRTEGTQGWCGSLEATRLQPGRSALDQYRQARCSPVRRQGYRT